MGKKLGLFAVVLVLVFVSPTVLAAESNDSANGEIPWWKVVTGIIAIPAGMVGLIYSYRLTQKTRLESRKLELDILEKEGRIPPGQERMPSLAESAASPKATATRAQDFIIRFIVLYLVLIGWGLIASLMMPFVGAGSTLIYEQELFYEQRWVAAFLVGLLSLVTQFGRWIAFLSIGAPLFIDIARFLGVTPRDLLWKRNKR